MALIISDLNDQRTAAIVAVAIECASAAYDVATIRGVVAVDDDGNPLLTSDSEPAVGDWYALHDQIGDYTMIDAQQFAAAYQMALNELLGGHHDQS